MPLLSVPRLARAHVNLLKLASYRREAATANQRALQIKELAALKADIDAGLADMAAGRMKDFDAARIVARGRKLLAAHSPSA